MPEHFGRNKKVVLVKYIYKTIYMIVTGMSDSILGIRQFNRTDEKEKD